MSAGSRFCAAWIVWLIPDLILLGSWIGDASSAQLGTLTVLVALQGAVLVRVMVRWCLIASVFTAVVTGLVEAGAHAA